MTVVKAASNSGDLVIVKSPPPPPPPEPPGAPGNEIGMDRFSLCPSGASSLSCFPDPSFLDDVDGWFFELFSFDTRNRFCTRFALKCLTRFGRTATREKFDRRPVTATFSSSTAGLLSIRVFPVEFRRAIGTKRYIRVNEQTPRTTLELLWLLQCL